MPFGGRAVAIGADAYLKPAVRAGKRVAPKIQRHSEHAIAHGGGAVRERAADLTRPAADAEQGEREVVNAAGRTGAVVQTALVGKFGSLSKYLDSARNE